MRVLLVDFNPFTAAVTPISLGHLGAVLRRAGHEVKVLSLGATSRFSPSGLASYLSAFAPALIGFGAYQRNLHHVRALAGLAKRVLPRCRVVLGGPQALFMPDEALESMPEVDLLSRGEGELTIAAIVEAMEDGDDGTPIPGVTSRLPDGGTVTAPSPEVPPDLDAYPSPWFDGVLDPADWDEAVLLTSRGCPHACAFCITPAACGRRYRVHSVERVLDEIAFIAARGVERLWFADPDFCCRESRVMALLEGVLQRGLKLGMWLETRADMVTPELIRLMQRAGVMTLAMGLESASDRVSRGLDKRIRPDQVAAAARSALAAGLDVELFSQFALPGEDFDDAMATLAFVKDCGVPVRGNSNAQQMQLYFGSEITRRPREHGVRPLREFPPHLSVGPEFETEWMDRRAIRAVKAAWQAASSDGGKRVVS